MKKHTQEKINLFLFVRLFSNFFSGDLKTNHHLVLQDQLPFPVTAQKLTNSMQTIAIYWKSFKLTAALYFRIFYKNDHLWPTLKRIGSPGLLPSSPTLSWCCFRARFWIIFCQQESFHLSSQQFSSKFHWRRQMKWTTFMITTYERKSTFHGWRQINHFCEVVSLLGQSMMVKGKCYVSLKSVQCLNVTTKYTLHSCFSWKLLEIALSLFVEQPSDCNVWKAMSQTVEKASWGLTWIINLKWNFTELVHWTTFTLQQAAALSRQRLSIP